MAQFTLFTPPSITVRSENVFWIQVVRSSQCRKRRATSSASLTTPRLFSTWNQRMETLTLHSDSLATFHFKSPNLLSTYRFISFTPPHMMFVLADLSIYSPRV